MSFKLSTIKSKNTCIIFTSTTLPYCLRYMHSFKQNFFNVLFEDGCHMWGRKCSLFTEHLISLTYLLYITIVNFQYQEYFYVFMTGLYYCIIHTVQITFIFIGQTRLVFGNHVCTCATKHSSVFPTFLNWLKNSKHVWHERNCTFRVCLFSQILICDL